MAHGPGRDYFNKKLKVTLDTLSVILYDPRKSFGPHLRGMCKAGSRAKEES